MDFLHSRSLLLRGKGTSKKEKDNDAVGGPSVEVETSRHEDVALRFSQFVQFHEELLDLDDS